MDWLREKRSKNRMVNIENPYKMNFEFLVDAISNTHSHFQQ